MSGLSRRKPRLNCSRYTRRTEAGRFMAEAILFDLGNTLVGYFGRAEFPAILKAAILGVQEILREQGLLRVDPETMWRGVRAEDHEAEDHRVRPLEGRLARIFQLELDQVEAVGDELCRRFTAPIFARGRCYEDTLPTLQTLRAGGYRLAVVSNTPWGSPGALWREELERLGLDPWLDAVVFCTDAGVRKPARQIFQLALAQLQLEPQDCLFVGDDPRWDLAGPRAMGMDTCLIDRQSLVQDTSTASIQNLHELMTVLQSR
jgi:putative hydrolase of the HAD superfamily